MDIRGVVRYFKSVEDVSALYLFGPEYGYPDNTMGLGVLADGLALGSADLDTLEQDCILRSSGPLSVIMLNTAPLYLKHYVASRGRMVFERHDGSHLKFTRRALDEYSSVAFHETDYEPGFSGIEYMSRFGEEEEYLG